MFGRLTILATCLTACTFFTPDDPSIAIAGHDGDLVIVVKRGDPQHSFGHVSATVNGVDAGQPQYAPGYDPGWIEGPYEGDPQPATETFVMSLALIDAGAQLEVNDDGARYVLDAPDLGLQRVTTVISPLDVPLQPGDFIEVGTGIAGEAMVRSLLKATDGDRDCFTAVFDTGNAFEVPPDLANWPASETCRSVDHADQVAIELAVAATASPTIATCSGPALTCEPIELRLPVATFDATLRL